MPGIDGLTLCHKIKTDPILKSIHVIMVSGKSFESEQKKAKELGAAAFLVKPYDVNSFSTIIAEILEPKSPKSGEAKTDAPILSSSSDIKPQIHPEISATIWGSRSKNLSSFSQYGTHTPCISLSIKEHTLVFDAGSGIEALGAKIAKTGQVKEIRIFLTHFHRAHVEGLLSFSSAQSANTLIHIAAAPEPGKTLPTLVGETLTTPGKTFPKAQFELHELRERSYKILPGIILHAFHANHPGTSLGFVLEAAGRKVAYVPDAEVYGPDVTAFQDYDEKFSNICTGVDVLIHDARYTQEDYEKNKSLGHSGFLNIVGLAAKAKVKRLILFHQDALYGDADLDKMAAEVLNFLSQKGSPMLCEIAREGLEIHI
jgi:phosphoribosyl 1,2-cyclic phosphodiesterase